MRDFQRLFPYLRPYVPLLVLSLLFLTLAGGMEVLITSLVAPIFDNVLASARGDAASTRYGKLAFIYDLLNLDGGNVLAKVVLALVVANFLKGACLYFSSYLMSYVGQSVMMRLRDALYRHIIKQSEGFFVLNSTGRLMSRVTSDVERLQDTVSLTMAELVREVILLALLLGYVFYLDWKLACIALVIAPAALYCTVNLGRRIRRVTSRSQESVADLANVLQEAISGHRIVKAFCMEDFEIKKFYETAKRLLSDNLKSAKIIALNSPLMEFLGVLSFIPLLAYAHYSIRSSEGNALTVGAFGTFLIAIFRMYDPIRKLSRIHIQFQQAFASSSRIFEVLDTHTEIKDGPNAIRLPRVRRAIEFKGVYFEYPDLIRRRASHLSPRRGDKIAALKNVNLRVEVGQVVALVGSSGSGKTTLVNLLPRFYDVSQGAILIDGIDIRQATLESLRAQISIVTQETFLFNDTVRNNIAYGRPGASDDEIINAAKAALAHDFIVRLPNGYDTVIGERGQRLSGGERQRISIARAILKDAPILILDEATSALDAESEKLVQQAIANLMKGRTVFVIAHRMSTVRMADMIVVLEDGEIKESGTHKLLLGRNGIYRRLYEMQFVDPDREREVRNRV